ncbi:MAG: iron-sulfur cluster carrier protein ApbC [Thermomicrobium sp.]|uniref:iron-sulfur cluster carrier protein ApbC n=1 Tax=Thermomicrobium sp. TaxID=1969469 RepID=UPI001B0C9523|nr:iron-sulfur cluster carrier protein ApbC [Thermomicrobium sp.]MBO9351244.1 iron-sulfur cluster carrier protein ApbC [Thermomicrobium sp.]
MSELTRERVLEALRPVQDPELHRSLVDLGMIKEVTIEGASVRVQVELTTPACPLRERIREDVERAVRALPGVQTVEVGFSSRVRPAGTGLPDRQPIPGVKNTIAVASGKGGVGKSTVAVNLAVALAQEGATVGLLDADVYGPSIPLMLGAEEQPGLVDNKIIPGRAYGIAVMSVGYILDPEKALIWRGPLVSQLIRQFLSDVQWGDLDYLVIDLPPGTGDVQLTLVQTIPLSGAIIVTTPQDVALADAIKGLQMFREVKTPVLGIVENMSYFVCPHCGHVAEIFGSGGGERVANKYGVPLLGQIPIDPAVREGGDRGVPVVVGQPGSSTAQAFREAARQAAARLSVEAVKKPRKPVMMLQPKR